MLINILVSYVITKNIFIALLVKNLSEKIVNCSAYDANASA